MDEDGQLMDAEGNKLVDEYGEFIKLNAEDF